MYHHSSLIFVLLILYCYSSPIPSLDEEEQVAFLSSATDEQSEMIEPFYTVRSNDMQSNTLNKIYYLKMLCARYGECSSDNQQMTGNNNAKSQRATSRLYYITPKFGKRVFTSAFAGIPKFG